MKTLKFIFLLYSVLTLFGAKSQNMGFIEYNIEIQGLTPDLKKAAALLIDSKMRVSYIDSAIRQDYALGNISRKTTILNYKMNEAIYYEDGTGGKYGVFGTCGQIDQLIQVDTTAKIEFIDEKKTILNYTCKKALLHFSSGETAEYWYCTSFPLQLPNRSFFNKKIPGVILEFSTTANGFFMKFQCSNYGNHLEAIEKLFLPKTTYDYKMIEFNSYLHYLYIQKQGNAKPTSINGN